jgi:hypothetical protein
MGLGGLPSRRRKVTLRAVARAERSRARGHHLLANPSHASEKCAGHGIPQDGVKPDSEAGA